MIKEVTKIKPCTRRFTTGYYYSSDGWPSANGTLDPSEDRLYLVPFTVSKGASFDRLCCEITTLRAGSNIRMGIFRDDGYGFPGVTIYGSGLISSATTGVKEQTIDEHLSRDVYWLGIVPQDGATEPIFRAWSTSGMGSPQLVTNSFQGTQIYKAYQIDGIGGAIPSTLTGETFVGASINPPKLRLRAA